MATKNRWAANSREFDLAGLIRVYSRNSRLSFYLTGGSDQFQQDPASARRMHKNITMPAGPDLNFVRDKTCTASFELLHCSRQIRDMDRHMMQPFAALGNKLGNYRIRTGGFQQLDAAFANVDHGHFDFLVRDYFFTSNL